MPKIDLIKAFEINCKDYFHQKILYGSEKVIWALKVTTINFYNLLIFYCFFMSKVF